jgi:hypothetical protein
MLNSFPQKKQDDWLVVAWWSCLINCQLENEQQLINIRSEQMGRWEYALGLITML